MRELDMRLGSTIRFVASTIECSEYGYWIMSSARRVM